MGLDRLKKWVEAKLSKGNCSVLYLGRDNLMRQYMLRATKLESISAAEHMGVLVDLHKLDMNQPCAFSARMNNGIFVCLRRNIASSFRVTLSLYSTLGWEARSLNLFPGLGPRLQKTNNLERD